MTLNLITNWEKEVNSGSGTPQRDFKGTPNLGRMACGLSTGDMADDEREDSSEPEPDYDDRDSGE